MDYANPSKSGKTEDYLTKFSERKPVDVEFNDICVSAGGKSSKLILRGVSGKFLSGQLTAILGPSGAGKSTLLNILAGYKCEGVTGSILINGQKRNDEKFTKISRYIMQNDHVQPYLTVQESMDIAANLKLGSKETKEGKEVMISEILDLLRLTRCKNTRASGLSGGERKRLSIALELINNPPVIFLDEPTTGLDDLACTQCIGLLKRLANGGRTVICVLHTPSAKLFSVFDNVYIVSKGQCVYQGYGPSVVPFLENIGLVCPTSYSPADFMMEVCSQEYGDFQSKMVSLIDNGRMTVCKKENVDQFTEMNKITNIYDQNQNYDDMKNTGSTFLEQIRILTVRMWLQTWRDKGGIFLKIVIYIFMALLIGNIYIGMGNDGSKTLFNFGYFYVCIIFLMYVPMMPVLLWFPLEIKVLKREHFNRWYGLGAYYSALTISTIPLQLAQTLVYFSITYVLTAQPLEPQRMFLFYIVCLVTSLIAESLGILIGALLSVVNALFIGTIVKIPMMLFATYGYGSGSETVPKWIKFSMYFSYLRYSMEGLATAMLKNRPIIPCPEEEQWCIYTDVSYFLKSMGMEKAVYWIDISALIFFLILFRSVGFYLLKQRVAPNRVSRAVNVLFKLVKAHFGP